MAWWPLWRVSTPANTAAGSIPKRHTAEEIVNKLRQAEVHLSKGLSIAQACKQIGITDQTYYRWRREYGGLSEMGCTRFPPGRTVWRTFSTPSGTGYTLTESADQGPPRLRDI